MALFIDNVLRKYRQQATFTVVEVNGEAGVPAADDAVRAGVRGTASKLRAVVAEESAWIMGVRLWDRAPRPPAAPFSCRATAPPVRARWGRASLWSGRLDLTRGCAVALGAIRGTGRMWARLTVPVPVSPRFVGLWTAMIIGDRLHHEDYVSITMTVGVLTLGQSS
ncbi:hypothetical protein [Jiangella rhizosphaerae]|uniref:hypothetical protein n=1 Tax=Jiangella rhizosphaerae TaxID=2293569 RepID=UPI0011C37BDD|nr:hypothetical protein [Jiangella rhizosphaerae]